MNSSESSKTLWQAKKILVLRVIGAGLLLLANVYIANLLGAEQLGYASFLLSVAMFGALFTVGGSSRLLTKHIPRVSDDPIKKAGFYLQGNFISLLYFALIFCGLYILFQILNRPDVDFGVTAGLVLVLSLKGLNEGFLLGESRAVHVVFFDAVFRPLALALGLFLLARSGLVSSHWYLLTMILVLALIWVVHSVRILPKLILGAYQRAMSYKEWVDCATPFFLITLAVTVQNQVGIFVLGILANDVETGIYAIALRLANTMNFAMASVNTAFMASYSRLFKDNNIEGLRASVREASLLSAGYAIILFLVFVYFSEPVLSFFGPEFTAGRETLWILAGAVLIAALCGPVGILMSMTDYADEASKVMLIAATINVFLCFLFVPVWGAPGAAFASMLSVMFSHITLLLKLRNRLRITSGLFGWIASR